MRKNDRKVKFVAGYDALVKGKILVFFIFVLADTVDDLCQRSVVGLQNSVKFNFFLDILFWFLWLRYLLLGKDYT